MKLTREEAEKALQESHPARGAWIEMRSTSRKIVLVLRRTPQGVRGLKFWKRTHTLQGAASHPARGAWIEISSKGWMVGKTKMVAPRKGCVD